LIAIDPSAKIDERENREPHKALLLPPHSHIMVEANNRPPAHVSVILSFWNEEDVLPELITRLRDVFKAERKRGRIASHELIFVNDASRDRSESIIREHAVGHDDIRLVNMSRNFGVSPCVLAGMRFASGDVVIYMDSDLQDPPEVIPQLLECYYSAADIEVVHTCRRRREGESFIKLAITRLGYAILSYSSSVPIQAEVGDFKLLSRRACDFILRFEEKQPFIRGLVNWIGFRQETIQYRREARFSGRTKFPVLSQKVIRNFLDSALIAFSDVPLKLTLLFGVFTFVLAFLYGSWIVIEKFRGRAVEGYASMMLVVLALGSMQFLLMGLMGLYINAIFLETKRRPNYIVKEIFGFPPTTSPLNSAEPSPAVSIAPPLPISAGVGR
jgi:glycosyltransferase involved in cell wall biosynthesis